MYKLMRAIFFGVILFFLGISEIEAQSCQACQCSSQTSSSPSPRISDGRIAERNEYPFFVLIRRNRAIICGSSLINDRYVLTAAHCVDDHVDTPGIFEVAFAEYDFTDRNDDKFTREVTEIILNNELADIALLKFDKITFNNKVYPICIPPSDLNVDNVMATALGYGRTTKNGYLSTRLKSGDMLIFSSENCWDTYLQNHAIEKSVYNEVKHVCAGDQRLSTCPGDSGGPLIIRLNGKDTVVGVVSIGSCDSTILPALFVRVSYFGSWIEENTADACSCPRLQ